MSEKLIPADKAEFFWNAEPGKAPYEFVITNIDERLARMKDKGVDPTRRYNASMGAHVADWLTGDGPQDHPEGLFVTEWLENGADRATIKSALREFGRIDRCEWARLMYSALDFYDRQNRNEE